MLRIPSVIPLRMDITLRKNMGLRLSELVEKNKLMAIGTRNAEPVVTMRIMINEDVIAASEPNPGAPSAAAEAFVEDDMKETAGLGASGAEA